MWQRPTRSRARPPRRRTPIVEALDARQLLAAGASAVGQALGPFLTPVASVPRVSAVATIVNPHAAINQLLSVQLGSGVETVEQQVEAKKTSSNALVANQVLANPFLHAVLSRQDTYTLLNAISGNTLSSAPTSATTQNTVTYNVPQQAVFSFISGTDQASVQVLPTATASGFFVTVPASSIRTMAAGSPVTATVEVPRSSIPSDAPLPPVSAIPTGPLSDVYITTGPVILSAFRSRVPHPGPNAPHAIPGLRLAGAFANNANFPVARTNALLYAFRVAVDRNVFALSTTQTNAVNAGLLQFEQTVASLNQSGTFQPSVPVAAPRLHRGPLKGTLEVSLGALRNLSNVDALQTGLPLPNVGNFPGRIDVGYVFDRNGNFGLQLTARGPLSGAPAGVSSATVVGGDVQVEVSNAPSLSALNGLRVAEGLNQGVGLSGGLSASTNSHGISTFGASAGYGSGLEFGTGRSYTQIIPLGNVYALIPESPKT